VAVERTGIVRLTQQGLDRQENGSHLKKGRFLKMGIKKFDGREGQ
jgi:hypothetical protein